MQAIDPAGDVVMHSMTALPLYTKLELDVRLVKDVRSRLFSDDRTFDLYCPSCKQTSTFKMASVEDPYDDSPFKFAAVRPDMFSQVQTEARKEAICARNHQHSLVCYFHFSKDCITKVGQFPSFADIAIPDNKRFAKVIGNDLLKQLNTAIGLHAHGVGIGAFVYLRRIFEALIESAYKVAKEEAGWDENAYMKAAMQERIKQLKGYLPRSIVSRPQTYAILSNHVHNMTDDECLRNFNTVKLGILMIAEEKLREHEAAALDGQLDAAINELHSQAKAKSK
jgi:hypothetical protein